VFANTISVQTARFADKPSQKAATVAKEFRFHNFIGMKVFNLAPQSASTLLRRAKYGQSPSVSWFSDRFILRTQ
jgi:hypothetical protein